MTRRSLATKLGHPDSGGKIPEARWVRAMAFERAVNAEAFVSELLTRAVGLLKLERPRGVRVRSGGDSADTTAKELASAHLKAKFADEATMLTRLAVPFLSLESEDHATTIKPDFAIVCPRKQGIQSIGSWLIMGDAKDYERVRARIDDGRMLKGFLQVALGAESAASWSRLPDGMEVHRYGALAVPRNVYLRPEALVEDLADHRREVRLRAQERIEAMSAATDDVQEDALADHLRHVTATFDPRSCATCSLFGFCRSELRGLETPDSLLTEIGVEKPLRPAVVGLLDGTGELGRAPASVVANVHATIEGLPHWTARRRTDMAGLPGSMNVVLIKSDSAALGVHGIAVQRLDGSGTETWQRRIFERTNATETRHAVMGLLGSEITQVVGAGQGPVHLVVPDGPTADVLVSMADSLAGVELSRLRWERDAEMGRPALTFDGEEATIPDALSPEARVTVSFLLEEDRARAMSLRQPVVNLRNVLSNHLVAGGPTVDSGRLDYLLTWAEADEPLDHRAVSDSIASSSHTPGARLANASSDEIHQAGRPGKGDPVRYDALVTAELDYRIDVLTRALTVLESVPDSTLRDIHRTLEMDAQAVWGRRLALEASDLTRFSRTFRPWRNAQVDMLDVDRKCGDQLAVLADRDLAMDKAVDAGVQRIARARVVSTNPIRLEVFSRGLVDGVSAVALHWGAESLAESAATTMKVQATSFKLGQAPLATLVAQQDVHGLLWEPTCPPPVKVGDELVLADMEWFGGGFRSGHELAIKRPSVDSQAAPKATCTVNSYAQDPAGHRWCCRSHLVAESEWSDTIAERRDRGELNPDVWPPIVDEDRFDLALDDDPATEIEDVPIPHGATIDDLD